jgi:hypothetical protein
MKKNKIIYLSLLLSMISLSACTDFLDVKDEAAINPSIWDNEESAKLYLNNIYSSCVTPFGGEDLDKSLANLSDETTDMSSSILMGLLSTGQIGVYKVGTYETIRYINIAFDAMKESNMTAAEKNRVLGQLYFFRAWQHWKLVNLYGGVPYIKNYVNFGSPDSIINAPRYKTSTCIQYLKEDLDSAISMLPASWGSKDYSRITRAAAAAFKGRILLFYASPQFNSDKNPARWQDAYNANLAARDLCLQDGYSLMSVVTAVTNQSPYGYDLNKIFMTKKSDVTNTEALIVTPYYTDVKSHGYENSVCPVDVTTNTGVSNCPSWDLVISFPMKDGSLAFKQSATVKNTRTFIGNGSDVTKFYLNRDPRFYATIAYNGCYYQLEGNANRRQWNFRFLRKNSTTNYFYSENTTSDKVSPTGFYCRKMVSPTILRGNMGKSSTDWIEMRYAEVLLNLAECAFETNNTETGYDCLKLIRSRAGIDAGTDGYYGLKSSSDITPIELVLNERKVELAFEGKRFYDLRRRNMFTSDLGTYIYKLKGWQKSGSGFIFELKNPGSDSIMFKNSALRDTIQFNNLYKYFNIIPKSTGPLVPKIAYICVPDSATLKTTTTGNYNFFDIPQDILTRSMAIKQNYGWQNGAFNPFQ